MSNDPIPRTSSAFRTATALMVAGAALAFLTGGCAGLPGMSEALPDAGPKAWVEFPYEGSILPMAPVTLVIYASDAGGINRVQATINGQALPGLPVSPMTTDGTTRLARVDHNWQPPGEGEYVVEAVGVGNSGTAGQPGSTRFCVVTCGTAAQEPVGTQTTTPTPAPGATLTPSPAAAGTPTPFGITASPRPGAEVTIEFFASPPYVNAGQCSTMHWDVTGTEAVRLDGAPVYVRGMEERCPCERETHTLSVTANDGSTQDRLVTIDVYGSCSTQPEAPSDTSGPAINAVYALWEGCEIYGQADVSDPAGVAAADFHFNLNSQGWSSISMSDAGGVWTSQGGVSVSDGMGTPQGSLEFKVRAVDDLGNESWSGVNTLNYTGCGGSQ